VEKLHHHVAGLEEAVSDLRHEMAAQHERWIAATLGGRKTKASGSQWNDPCDVRENRYADSYAFAYDGKSTRGKSVSVTRDMLKKLVEQAGGERPMLPIRFYDDDRLRRYEDWVLLRADDFQELRDGARSWYDAPPYCDECG
jgi:hypothetical protein